ncbi:MAG: hypothetical protein KA316_05110 [Rhodoferax sp.]|nr:hypothetical protein [Rhodoferax sp.]
MCALLAMRPPDGDHVIDHRHRPRHSYNGQTIESSAMLIAATTISSGKPGRQ